MADWPVVLFPAALVALTTRLDAKVVGPYFALSAVIAASEGMSSAFWYGDTRRRAALGRRFVYPCVAGFCLAWADVDSIDIAATGALSAGLLIWPVVFGGLPWYVPRRSWHLPTLYFFFVLACGLASLVGQGLHGLVVEFADGDVRGWLAEQLLSMALLSMATVIAILIFRLAFRGTRAEAERRERAGAEEQ